LLLLLDSIILKSELSVIRPRRMRDVRWRSCVKLLILWFLCEEVLKRDVWGSSWEARLFHSSHEVLIRSHISKIWHIIVWRKSYCSGLWENTEPCLQRLSFLLVWMIVRTMRLGARVLIFNIFALIKFIVFGMIF